MAVISCDLQSDGRTLSIDERGGFTYGATYHVRTDDKTDDQLFVWAQAQLVGPDPAPGWMSTYALGSSLDVNSFVQGYEVGPLARIAVESGGVQSAGTLWEVRVVWRPLPPGKPPTETQTAFDSPLLRPLRHWSEMQPITEILEEDFEGNPIANGAGQPFDEPAEVDSELEVLVFEKNYATANEIRALNRQFRRKLNASAYAGYAAKHCLCLPIRMSRPLYENGVTFYTATARIVCADKPWARQFVNRGYKHYEGTGGDKKLVVATDPVTDENGVETGRVVVPEPVLLTDATGPDGAGYRLAAETAGNVVTFQTEAEAEFTAINGFPFIPPS